MSRAKGQHDPKSVFPRDYDQRIRCTKGFKDVIALLKEEEKFADKSDSDILHDALKLFALKNLGKEHLMAIATIQ